MIKLLLVFISVIALVAGSSFIAAAAPVGNALILEEVTQAIKSDSRWGGAFIEISELDLSALSRRGKGALIEGYDNITVKFLGQVRPGKRFTMKLVFSKDDKPMTEALATARINAFKDVVVAMRSLRIRDKVGFGDVRVERMQLRELDAPVFVSVKDVVGMRVRRPIRAGAYLKRNYIQPETTIRRGDKVIVVAESGILRVRSKARALEDGYPGSVVEARTVGGKVVFGTVNERGELSVAF